jgi:hypothetical protein
MRRVHVRHRPRKGSRLEAGQAPRGDARRGLRVMAMSSYHAVSYFAGTYIYTSPADSASGLPDSSVMTLAGVHEVATGARRDVSPYPSCGGGGEGA